MTSDAVTANALASAVASGAGTGGAAPGDNAGDGQLAPVIDRQRRALDALRAASDVASVVAMARGVLMERSGATVAEAATQLADMAAAAGLPMPEIAAAVLHRELPEAAAGRHGTGSWRLGELLALSAAERADEGAELVGVVADQVLGPFGAAAVAIWLLGPDGGLELLGERGIGGMASSHGRFLPPLFDCPARRVVSTETDLWWATGPPPGDPPALLVNRWGNEAARAVLGLRGQGTLLGVLQVWWPGPLAGFAAETRQRLSGLAAGFAGVLAARLADGGLVPFQDAPAVLALLAEAAGSVLVAEPVRDASGSVTDFTISHLSEHYLDPAGRGRAELAGMTLLEAYPGSVATGLFARASRVLASGAAEHVPGAVWPPLAAPAADPVPVADLAVAPFFTGVAATWRAHGEARQTVELLGHAQRLGQLGGWQEDLVTGAVQWTGSTYPIFGLDPVQATPIPTAQLHNFVMATDRAQLRRFRERLLLRREADSAVFRVVRPGDGTIRQIKVFAEPVTIGTELVALRGAFQDVSAHYHTQVALAATRDQLADTEQLAAEEHQLAIRLQQAIMPPGQQPAAATGIELAVRYRPVEPGRLVGGDWYDSMLLPDKEMLVVVGDITGHGIDAVTGMVAARNALRGLAATGGGPADLLGHLNQLACHFADGLAGTVICARYNPESGLLRWARAGHLPPVLVRGQAAGPLPLPGGVLLGLDPDAVYEEAETQLRSGDMLLMFTDGLVERRGQSITDTLDEFVSLAAAAPRDVSLAADHMLASALSDTGDDACLVALRVR